jgi:hypothetical protein
MKMQKTVLKNILIISVLKTQKTVSNCSCSLKLGLEQLSIQDVLDAKELERKHKLVNQAIHFHGSCDFTQHCTIKEKIYELKDKIAEYYFDPQKKLIAIPNQITDKPTVSDKNETDKKRQIKIGIENDKYYEDLLHLNIIDTLQKFDSEGFVLEGFHSGNCLQAKVDLGKQLRKDNLCKCKPNQTCTCGKSKHLELNVHEIEVMDILEASKINDNELARYKIIYV